MALQGKGMMIWKISRCENGDPKEIANVAKSAGLTHVLIKIADGPYAYNTEKDTNKDLVPPVIDALRSFGIKPWGWHYVYGYNPSGEAQIAIKRVKQLGLEGYVIDAEGEYKEPGKDKAATKFMGELRKGIPNTPVALCSYRWPSYHPQLPWKEFLEKCDFNMPQVYWQASHNPEDQLRKTVREFQALTPYRPIIPTGPVYKYGGWEPTPADIQEFLNTARALDLPAANFFEWYYGRTILRPLWNTIAAYSWPPYPTPIDLPELYISSLNTHNAGIVTNLYTENAVHITSAQTIQGIEAIKTWHNSFLNQTLPNAEFQLTGASGTGSSRHFTWKANSSAGKIKNGNDTIGIVGGKIAYHYSYFTIT